MIRVFVILSVLVSSFVMSASEVGRNTADPEFSIECRMDPQTFYERQPVPMVVTLISSTPNIALAEVRSAPSLTKGEFASVQKVSPAGSAYKEVSGGKTYYCFPLEAYMVTMSDKGKYEIGGGEYEIGVSFPAVVNDPFWGKRRTSVVKRFSVPVDKRMFNVKSLPTPPASVDFSGSVGKFTIETVVPRGDIFVNEEAVAVVVLRGTGMIADSTLPEYRNAFRNGVRLKSISESRDAAYDNGQMISELSLECTFIPDVRDGVEIGEVTFCYFDPEAGEYRTARSAPVRIDVKSTTSKRESISI